MDGVLVDAGPATPNVARAAAAAGSVLGTLSLEPEVIAAVLHGILVGPGAPVIEQRSITAPTLIIGHERDLIHPFSDAENLAKRVPGARLVQAHSMYELRLTPEQLTREIVRFLDGVDFGPELRRVAVGGEAGVG